MFFTGDIAQPSSAFNLPETLPQEGAWIGNLEGSLVKNGNNVSGVYNDYEGISELCKRIPFAAFGIANNHLTDFAGVETTLNNAQDLGITTFGAGNNLKEAQQSIVIADKDGSKYRLLAFGWENISCRVAKEKQEGVNPYTKKNVKLCAKEALKQKEPVVCFMHWNYELERYPQPYDRQLAHELIDMGVCAVIGCHAHCVQPIEFYKGRPIVYGLGNFLFCEGHYFRGRLRFPKSSEDEYVFEICKGGEQFKLHYYKNDQIENKLAFVKSIEVNPDVAFDGKAVFSGFSPKEYEDWFKANRSQKKLLPIFKSKEVGFVYSLKSYWIKVRGAMIVLMTKLNIKSLDRAK